MISIKPNGLRLSGFDYAPITYVILGVYFETDRSCFVQISENR